MRRWLVIASAASLLGGPVAAVTAVLSATPVQAASSGECNIKFAVEDLLSGDLRGALEDVSFNSEAFADLRQGHLRGAYEDCH